MWAQSCVKAPAGSKLYVSCCVAKVEAYVSATWIGLNEQPWLVLSRFCVRHCRGSSRKRSENKVTFKRATGKKGKGFGRSKEKKKVEKGNCWWRIDLVAWWMQQHSSRVRTRRQKIPVSSINLWRTTWQDHEQAECYSALRHESGSIAWCFAVFPPI